MTSTKIKELETRICRLEAVLERVIERDKSMAGHWWPTLEGVTKKPQKPRKKKSWWYMKTGDAP